ncbi:putative disease resistance RPP13-like protein 1 [Senna tora]|uniref:Putative disease resistance RPP13-like protein 1 n=1 Tax=Senna tora TaxID=362788 RepID=A0A834X9W8_9FABA|nr:putative disease resistance RPP13-like protein 1 [Senna tora]
MHDLIHDLSISVGGKFFHSLEVGNGNKIPKTTRHLSCDVANVDVALSTVEKESLRALVVKNMNSSQQMTETHINTLMLSKCLRVLSIRGFTNLEELPDSIGELIHLRYLDLSSTNIERLPESLCKLHNLQTLKLEHCQFLTLLPNSMQDLVNLRHLDVSGTSLREMPKGIGKLKNLQFLSDFVISKNEGAKIEEIGGLPSLCKYLGIWNLESVSKSNEALEAKMMHKNRLETLMFKWTRDEDTINSQNEGDILDKLQPHSNLKRLTIDGYRGTRFPDWLDHSSYHNMVYLRLLDCKNCCMLPSLGQLPSLKELIIQGLDSMVSIGPEFYKTLDSSSETLTPFASLESLEFRFMYSWENWSSQGMEAFPKLQRLRMYFCCELTGDLPKSQQHLALEVDQCPALLNRCIPESVEDLTIKYSCECDSLPSFSSDTFSNLKHLKIIGEYGGVKCFPEDGLLTASLNSLELDDFSCLETLDCEVFRSMTSLEQVTIKRCPMLDKMTVERLAASVRSHIKIEACDLIQAEEVPHLTNVHVSPYYV